MPFVGKLDEATFTARVQAGCPECGHKKLSMVSYVEGKFPLIEGEPTGAVAWAYKGEGFVDGVFEMTCAGCKRVLFEEASCPRCHAEGGLAKALGSENAYAFPKVCPGCRAKTLTLRAMVPARVVYDAGRATPARTSTTVYDEGFHAVGVDCGACGAIGARVSSCPLCGAQGPLRAVPR